MGGQTLEGPSRGAHDSLDRGRDWSGQVAHLLHDSLFNNTWQLELDHEQQAVELHLQVTKACDRVSPQSWGAAARTTVLP